MPKLHSRSKSPAAAGDLAATGPASKAAVSPSSASLAKPKSLGLLARLKDPVHSPLLTPPPDAKRPRKKWTFYDSQGRGPFARFLQPDDPTVAYPTARVAIMMLFGFVLSAFVIWLSEDEFFAGTSPARARKEDLTPFPVHIAFKDVGCSVSHRDSLLQPITQRDILYNVTGVILPGRLTGILGQSGSGKTTFAHQLLGRGHKMCSKASGAVYMNGRPRSLEAFMDRVGFVPQADVLYDQVSVEEALAFSSQWRLPRGVSEEERRQIIDETLAVLDLTRVRHSRARVLSGGERRRLSIGIELVARPSVLVLDEPTSGLDGAAAYNLVETLSKIAASNVSVVAVLHQPSARVFRLLQGVILMSRGSAVFQGEPQQVVPYLASQGFADAPGGSSARSEAEFIMDVLAGHEQGDVSGLASAWRRQALTSWPAIEAQMESYRQAEDAAFKRLSRPSRNPGLGTRLVEWTGLLDHCKRAEHGDDPRCVVFYGTPFPVLPKQGLQKQVHLWFWQMVRITLRRGVGLHMGVLGGLAGIVSFVRSYNMAWSQRGSSNFMLSLAVSLMGMVGAVFSDDIRPVERAANSGMILAAHELAQLAHSLVFGWMQCHWFAAVYLFLLWVRHSDLPLYTFGQYYEFAHILHLNFLVSSGLGAVICIACKHDLGSSFLVSIGILVHMHVFAGYSPTRSQVARGSKALWDTLDLGFLANFFIAFSNVRYFMEAMMLHEPDRSDKIGRTFALTFYGYREQNFTWCLTILFALWMLTMGVRFVLFAVANANAFNSSYDLPLFLLFIVKVLFFHIVALVLMTAVHETIQTVVEKDVDAPCPVVATMVVSPAPPAAEEHDDKVD